MVSRENFPSLAVINVWELLTICNNGIVDKYLKINVNAVGNRTVGKNFGRPKLPSQDKLGRTFHVQSKISPRSPPRMTPVCILYDKTFHMVP